MIVTPLSDRTASARDLRLSAPPVAVTPVTLTDTANDFIDVLGIERIVPEERRCIGAEKLGVEEQLERARGDERDDGEEDVERRRENGQRVGKDQLIQRCTLHEVWGDAWRGSHSLEHPGDHVQFSGEERVRRVSR
jgi:hypothetical protein